MDITSYLLGKKAGGGGTVNLQNKSLTVTNNGTQNITADSGYDGLSKVELTTNVQSDLESKSITITENTTTTITPSQDKDGISSVSVVTNVPQGITPTGTINITENGTVDVTNYASANVNVSGGASDYFEDKNSSETSLTCGNWIYNIKKLDFSLAPGRTKLTDILRGFPGTDLSLCNTWNTSSITTAGSAFYECSKVTTLSLNNWNTSNITVMNSMFTSCSKLTNLNLNNWDTSKVTDYAYMFYLCSDLENLDLSSFTFGSNPVSMRSMFASCSKLMFLDLRGFVFSSQSFAYNGLNGTFNSVPTNCLIVVKDDTEKTWFNTQFPTLTNVQTVAEYEAS